MASFPEGGHTTQTHGPPSNAVRHEAHQSRAQGTGRQSHHRCTGAVLVRGAVPLHAAFMTRPAQLQGAYSQARCAQGCP